jgi:hypothetical protein
LEGVLDIIRETFIIRALPIEKQRSNNLSSATDLEYYKNALQFHLALSIFWHFGTTEADKTRKRNGEIRAKF